MAQALYESVQLKQVQARVWPGALTVGVCWAQQSSGWLCP